MQRISGHGVYALYKSTFYITVQTNKSDNELHHIIDNPLHNFS